MNKFMIRVLNGRTEMLVAADSVRVYNADDEWIELCARRSDGEIILRAKSQLVIRPHASNCARVASESS